MYSAKVNKHELTVLVGGLGICISEEAYFKPIAQIITLLSAVL
jgi:hypothetical protein